LLGIGTISYFDRLNVSVLIADPVFLKSMGIDGNAVKMGLLMTVFTIGYGVSSFLFSSLGDKYGPRRIISAAIILWALSMFVGPVAGTFAILLTTRAFLGIGEGLHWPMQAKYVSNWFPPNEQGRANGIWLLGPKLGPALSVPLFAFIVSHWGWQATFYSLGVASLFLVVVIWLFAPDTPEESKWVNKAELDYIVSGRGQLQQAGSEKKGSFVDSVKVVIADSNFWILTVYYCCQCAIFWGLLTWLPSYLKVARGFSWAAMGGYTAMTWISAAVMVLVVGAWSDKAGRRSPFQIVAMLGYGIGILLSSQVPDNTTAAVAIVVAGALGSGFGMPTTWALVGKIVPKEAVSTGSGLLNGISVGVGALMPTLIGYLISLTGHYTGGLLSMVAFAALGLVCAVILTFRKY
jgi:sugar phosphate permease